MRVLVTGASGHVGGAIAAHFVAAGASVVGLSRGPHAGFPATAWVQCDLAAPGAADAVGNGVAPCDVVVHAAAALDKDLFADAVVPANCFGTQQMLKLAAGWKSFFVYISGVPVIGRPTTLPVTEDHATHPPTAYHAAKLFGEHLTAIAASGGAGVSALRLTSPVGPGLPAHRILSVFVAQALSGGPIELSGQGTRRQDYVDVRDVAIAVEQCAARRATGTFNVASGHAVSNRELAERCISSLGSTSTIRLNGREDPEDDWIWDVSIDRAREAFDYRPRYSIEDSIRSVAMGIRGDRS